MPQQSYPNVSKLVKALVLLGAHDGPVRVSYLALMEKSELWNHFTLSNTIRRAEKWGIVVVTPGCPNSYEFSEVMKQGVTVLLEELPSAA